MLVPVYTVILFSKKISYVFRILTITLPEFVLTVHGAII